MISIIAAIDENRGVGKNNELLFKISDDLKRFKRLTTGHAVVMGRKTFESIGKALPNRTNIVITRDVDFEADGVSVVHSLEEAIEFASSHDEYGEVFVIGGGQIFKQALPIAHRLYLTIVHGKHDADTFFPDYSEFTKIIEKEDHVAADCSYTFLTLEK